MPRDLKRKAAYLIAWLAAHPGKSHEYSKKYRQLHPDKRRASKAAWREKNKEHVNAHARDWYSKHPESGARNHALRRAHQLGTVCDLTAADIRAIKAGGCRVCGTHERLDLAHDVAVAKGGHTTKRNCFCLCHTHNLQMGTMDWRTYKAWLKRKHQPVVGA